MVTLNWLSTHSPNESSKITTHVCIVKMDYRCKWQEPLNILGHDARGIMQRTDVLLRSEINMLKHDNDKASISWKYSMPLIWASAISNQWHNNMRSQLCMYSVTISIDYKRSNYNAHTNWLPLCFRRSCFCCSEIWSTKPHLLVLNNRTESYCFKGVPEV